MWFAARDIAFEHPVTDDMTQTMLERMGIVAPGGKPPTPEEVRRNAEAMRRFPDLDLSLEMMLRRMVGLALHRGVGVPHVRVGRGGARRPRPRRRRRRGGRARELRPRRRDAARRVPAHRAHRDARPHVRRGVGPTHPGHRGDRRRSGTPRSSSRWARTARTSCAQATARGRARARRHTRDAPTCSKASTRSASDRDASHEVRDLLRAPAAAPVGRRLRVPPDPGRARADRVRRPDRHRLRVGGRAPLPRGVLALERARGVPRRRVATHATTSGSGTASCRRRRRSTIPARIAERIAMLDLVSNGRADFGTGESSSEAELGGFMVDPAEKRAMWEEGLRVAVRCMTEEPFTGHSGEYVTMPPRNVVPKPRQKPHPPLWVACSRRDTIHLAAQHGDRRARVRVRRSRRGEVLGRRLLRDARPRRRADRRRGERRTSRASRRSCATTTRTRRCAAGSRARTSSATRSRTTTCSAATSPRVTNVWDEFQTRRAEQGFDPEAVQRRGRELRPARREGRRAGRRRSARRGRHARPDPRVPRCATRSAASTR